MIFSELQIPGVFRIDVEPFVDARGCFARFFCADEFRKHSLVSVMCQASLSTSHKRGTLRGMHFRDPADGEAKLVRCTQGKAFDVVLDLRPQSSSYRGWIALELSASERNAVYVPPGCAHGFLSLTDSTDILYMMSVPFVPDAESGVLWNDPAFGIAWPMQPSMISDRDRNFAPYFLHEHKA